MVVTLVTRMGVIRVTLWLLLTLLAPGLWTGGRSDAQEPPGTGYYVVYDPSTGTIVNVFTLTPRHPVVPTPANPAHRLVDMTDVLPAVRDAIRQRFPAFCVKLDTRTVQAPPCQ